MNVYLSMLRSLADRVHILVLSLLIVAVTLGFASASKPSAKPVTGSKHSQTSFSVATSPTTGDDSEDSNSYESTPSNGSGGSYEGQNDQSETEQSTSISNSAPISPSNPIQSNACSPCATVQNCMNPDSCDPLPTPAPSPNGCGYCGESSPPYHHLRMCAMYCAQDSTN